MRELFVTSQTATGEDGVAHQFDYYVLIDEMRAGNHAACESYGVKVAEQGGDTARVPNITVEIARIDGLIGLLTRNVVGPSGLGDVVADWL